MSLSLLEVVAAVRARRASLSAETVGYLLLGVADHVIGVPREIGAADVLLGAEGAVRVGVGKVAAPERTERALRELLDALLSVASTATPALLRIGRRQASAGVEALVRELEAALIPVNRAAARRALTRLYRDTQRAAQAGPLDVAAAQAWLKRAMAPSTPAPAVASEPSLAVGEPVLDPVPPSEVPVEVFEASQPSSIAVTRPPPLIEARPVFETLTRPEPVLVRAAARARVEVREQQVDQEPPALTGTPLLGTFAARAVLAPVTPAEDSLLLNADEATERTPEVIVEPVIVEPVIVEPVIAEPVIAEPVIAEPVIAEPVIAEPVIAEPVIAEPVVPLVKTAPLVDVVTAPVASDELSAELASVVADTVTEGDEPASPLALAVPEAPAAFDGEFDLDDEIVIVVDEDLEAFEPELLPAPIADRQATEVAASEQCQNQAADPPTRDWSSPEPPELIEPESGQETPPAAVEVSTAFELPSVPELELPPLPEFVAWPTPEPQGLVAAIEERPSAVSAAAPSGDADVDFWEPEPNDEAYFEAWEPDEEAYFEPPEPEPDDADFELSEPEANDDADFEAAAAGYVAQQPESSAEPEPMPVAEPVVVERRILSLPEATDYSEVGWTPAPSPQEPPEQSLAPETAQTNEPEPPPEPVVEPAPEPAPPRFAPRRSDVSELLRGFAVTEARSDRELCRDLKALAGVDLTPGPPGSRALR